MRVPNDFVFETPDLEVHEELEAVAWAENHGWLVRKTKYIGVNGCPDRFFFGYGHIVMIEFKKKKGGRLSLAQIEEHKRLAEAGTPAVVCTTSQAAIAILQGCM